MKERIGPALQKIAGGLILAITLILATFVAFNLVKDGSLWVFGTKTAAIVTDRRYEMVGDPKSTQPQFRYYVSYQFTTPDGKTYGRASKVDVIEWSRSNLGWKVPVAYFPLYPAYNRLDDSRYVPFLACLYVPLLVLVLVGYKVGGYLVQSS